MLRYYFCDHWLGLQKLMDLDCARNNCVVLPSDRIICSEGWNTLV